MWAEGELHEKRVEVPGIINLDNRMVALTSVMSCLLCKFSSQEGFFPN